MAESNIPRVEDPLKYWEAHKCFYPNLYVLAQTFLCCQASSVPCERVFSKAWEIISKKRNRLSPKTKINKVSPHVAQALPMPSVQYYTSTPNAL